MTRDPELQEFLDKILIGIAQKHFPSVETLKVRNSDSLDFHDVYVESIKEALQDAFFVGMVTRSTLS
tara:strand:+ start:754 stop:954 length:201 start_codon:yes stop_codon:yes gene_type:complete